MQLQKYFVAWPTCYSNSKKEYHKNLYIFRFQKLSNKIFTLLTLITSEKIVAYYYIITLTTTECYCCFYFTLNKTCKANLILIKGLFVVVWILNIKNIVKAENAVVVYAKVYYCIT